MLFIPYKYTQISTGTVPACEENDSGYLNVTPIANIAKEKEDITKEIADHPIWGQDMHIATETC